MPLVIGLTGGIGSGKSSVADIFGELGAAVVDADDVSHELTAPGALGALAIAREFGADYLTRDGALDRHRMRELVFADAAAKQKLEAILHPMIHAQVETAVRAANSPYVVLVTPLLVETGAFRHLVRRVLVVDCDEELQVARVMQRSGLTAAMVQAIMAQQASRAARLKIADDVLVNQTDRATLRTHAIALHRQYLELAAASATAPGMGGQN